MVAPNARSSVWLSFDGRNRQELMQGDWYNQFNHLHIHRNLSWLVDIDGTVDHHCLEVIVCFVDIDGIVDHHHTCQHFFN